MYDTYETIIIQGEQGEQKFKTIDHTLSLVDRTVRMIERAP